MNNFKEYMQEAEKTAIYPYKGQLGGLDYCICALCGEVGEAYNKIKKCIRDHNWTITEEKNKEISMELAGAMWYISQIFVELQVQDLPFLEEDLELTQEKIFKNVKESSENKIKNIKFYLSPAYIYSGDLLNLINTVELSEEEPDMEKLYKEVLKTTSKVYSSIICVCKFLEVDFKNILKDNIKLLSARKETGTINGSGDGVKDRL